MDFPLKTRAFLPGTLACASALILSGCGRLPQSPAELKDGASLSPQSQDLYAFVMDEQIREADDPRWIGAWPSRASTRGGRFAHSRDEANLFMGVQNILALSRVPGISVSSDYVAANQLVAGMVDSYIEDGRKTGEPAGSVSHWALYETIDGKDMRMAHKPRLPYALIKHFDIPNDLDTSSQTYIWAAQRGTHKEFRKAYPSMLANWIDRPGRDHQHRQDDKWKEPGSGAFLTWIDPDKADDRHTRVPGGVNDVDCVVNMNVLTSLAVHDALGLTDEPVPAATRDAASAACSLVVRAFQAGKAGVCSAYYDETHALMAFARSVSMGVACLEPARDAVISRLTDLAGDIGDDTDPVDLAELALAWKLLVPPSERVDGSPVFEALFAELKDRLEYDSGYAWLPEGVIYHGTSYPLGLPVTGYWYSRAAGSTLALLALATP